MACSMMSEHLSLTVGLPCDIRGGRRCVPMPEWLRLEGMCRRRKIDTIPPLS